MSIFQTMKHIYTLQRKLNQVKKMIKEVSILV